MVLNRSVSGQKPPDDPVSEQRRSEEDVSLETGASVEATTNTKVAEPPYTIFDLWRRYLLMSLLSLIGIWSAISNSIYFPAIPTLEREFDVSSEAINLTMVAYLVLQGLAPTLVSNFADTYGRRPMVLIAFCVYIGANIGLAVCNTYWLLVFLRCVQAGGIAQVIAINSGIAGDVCVPANRGAFVGVVSGMLLVGQAFGSLIGSALIARWNWRAVFVFLAIGAGVTLLFIFVFLTETCRSIAGNGSVRPKNPIHIAPALYFPGYKEHMNNNRCTIRPRVKLDFLAPWRILIRAKVMAVLLPGGLQFTAWTMSLTSLSTALENDPWNYSVFHVGLMYLPQGICCLVASLLAGRMLNYYYGWRRGKFDKKYEDCEKEQRPPFNKIRVRLDLAIIPTICTLLGLLLFGWTLDKETSVVGVVIGTCFTSFGTSSFIAIVTTMLVDLYPSRGLASTSCVNFVRCILAAAFIAALDRMVKSMGIGWVYTLMAALCLVANLLLIYVVVQHLKHLKRNL
uniref:Major facilitator superfamily (MFS) profile domain-containing protein n=1 Tax=Candidozyma auris TaxID=498019 RepID=A0A0L0NS01_CANAR